MMAGLMHICEYLLLFAQFCWLFINCELLLEDTQFILKKTVPSPGCDPCSDKETLVLTDLTMNKDSENKVTDVVDKEEKENFPVKPNDKERLFPGMELDLDRQWSKRLHCNIYFATFTGHHPPEINGISWSLLNKEWWRLSTFSKYPTNALCHPTLLARQGFCYIGNCEPDDDTVLCVFCLSAVKILTRYANVEDLHRSLNPDCPMVTKTRCGNIMIEDRDFSLFPQLFSHLKQIGVNSTNQGNRQQCEEGAVGQLPGIPQDNNASSGCLVGSAGLGTDKKSLLMRENTYLRLKTFCHLCKVNDLSSLFLPCGHVVMCFDCSISVVTCPFEGCQETILAIKRIFKT